VVGGHFSETLDDIHEVIGGDLDDFGGNKIDYDFKRGGWALGVEALTSTTRFCQREILMNIKIQVVEPCISLDFGVKM